MIFAAVLYDPLTFSFCVRCRQSASKDEQWRILRLTIGFITVSKQRDCGTQFRTHTLIIILNEDLSIWIFLFGATLTLASFRTLVI